MNFIELVQARKINGPNSKEYSIDNWIKEFSKINDPTSIEVDFFKAGIIFFRFFQTIRSNVDEMEKYIPTCTNETIVRLHCAMSNLSTISLNLQYKPLDSGIVSANIPAKFNTINGEIKVPPQDIADSAVDSIELALRKRLGELDLTNKSIESLDFYTFMKYDSIFSELYYAFEYYWKGVLWGTYSVSDEKDKIIIKQMRSVQNLDYIVSLNRKMKLESGKIQFLSKFVDKFDDQKVLTLKKGNPVIRKAKDLEEKNKYYNCLINCSAILSEDDFPEELMSKNLPNKNFSINKIIKVFSTIVTFSRSVFDSLPKQDIESFKDVTSYSPKFKIDNIIRNASKVSGLTYLETSEIIDFLTFEPHKKNLWSYPIIKVRKNHLILLLSAIITPHLNKNIEYWLRDSFPKKLNEKGYKFEEKLINKVNNAIDSNVIFSDSDSAISKKIRISKDNEEEIDCIFRFGKNIVICEAKCIVTIDSQDSIQSTKKSLTKASLQAKRKLDFVRDNLKKVFETLGWDYLDNVDYRLVPVVVNSNKIFSGHVIDEVAVTDEIIMGAFFESLTTPLFTTSEEETIAWFEIYKNLEEAENNFELYLKNPPQFAINGKYVDYNSNTIQSDLLGVEVQIENLVVRDFEIREILRDNYAFPISTVADIDSKLDQIDLII